VEDNGLNKKIGYNSKIKINKYVKYTEGKS